jgi:hypothetical protein
LERLHIGGTGNKALITPVTFGVNQDSAYLIAGSPSYTGTTTNWGTFGFQHRIKSNAGGAGRVTIDTKAGEAFCVTDNNLVGIGTSSPGAIIHSTPAAVNGGLATAFLATQAGAGVNTGTALRFGWGSSNGSFSEISAALQATGVGTNLDLKTSTDNSTAASTKVRITSAGLVGIGSSAPVKR